MRSVQQLALLGGQPRDPVAIDAPVRPQGPRASIVICVLHWIPVSPVRQPTGRLPGLTARPRRSCGPLDLPARGLWQLVGEIDDARVLVRSGGSLDVVLQLARKRRRPARSRGAAPPRPRRPRRARHRAPRRRRPRRRPGARAAPTRPRTGRSGSRRRGSRRRGGPRTTGTRRHRGARGRRCASGVARSGCSPGSRGRTSARSRGRAPARLRPRAARPRRRPSSAKPGSGLPIEPGRTASPAGMPVSWPGLRLAVAVVDVEAHRRPEHLHHLRVERLAGGDEVPQRRQAEAVERGPLGDHPVLGRRLAHDVDLCSARSPGARPGSKRRVVQQAGGAHRPRRDERVAGRLRPAAGGRAPRPGRRRAAPSQCSACVDWPRR